MRRPPIALAAILALALGATACNRGTVPSGKAFCDRVGSHLDQLKGPVTDLDAAKRSVQAYKDVQTVAPAPVRDAWAKVTSLVEAAATLDISSPTEQSAFAEKALAADRDVKTVAAYVKDTCGLSLDA